jgi:hypothetical protein
MSEHVGATPRSRARVGAVLLRLVVVAGLAVDVYVHLHLAAGMTPTPRRSAKGPCSGWKPASPGSPRCWCCSPAPRSG